MHRNFSRNLFCNLNRNVFRNLTRNFNRYDFRNLYRNDLSNKQRNFDRNLSRNFQRNFDRNLNRSDVRYDHRHLFRSESCPNARLAPLETGHWQMAPRGVAARLLDLCHMLHILTSAMALQLPQDLDARVQAAVRYFWDMRSTQASNQKQRGNVDQGARSAVTGGAQMDGFIDLFAELALWAGARPKDVLRGAQAELPGLFRPTVRYDLLVNRGKQVICAYKFACLPALFSQEHLNRIAEDSIAGAHELWGAYRRSAINFDIDPWLGYVLAVEGTQPRFTAQSAEDLCRRLVLERLYSDAAFVLAKRDGSHTEPADGLTLAHLCRILVARVAILAAA